MNTPNTNELSTQTEFVSISSKLALRLELEEKLEKFIENGGKISEPEKNTGPKISGGTWNRSPNLNYQTNTFNEAKPQKIKSRDSSNTSIKAKPQKPPSVKATPKKIINKKIDKKLIFHVPTEQEVKNAKEAYDKKLANKNVARRNAYINGNSPEQLERIKENNRKRDVKLAHNEAIKRGESTFMAPCKHHEMTLFQIKNSVVRCIACRKGKGKPKPTQEKIARDEIYAKNRQAMFIAIKSHEETKSKERIEFLGHCFKCGPNSLLRARKAKVNGKEPYYYLCIGCQAKASYASGLKRSQRIRENKVLDKPNNNLVKPLKSDDTIKNEHIRLKKNRELMEAAIKEQEKNNATATIEFIGCCSNCKDGATMRVVVRTKDKRTSYFCVKCAKDARTKYLANKSTNNS